ncbi:MAG: hypothetical protein LBU87_06680, partial [Lactobacillales bacterium]|nr:hypothetical protein [Lactobacillales bacterium]
MAIAPITDPTQLVQFLGQVQKKKAAVEEVKETVTSKNKIKNFAGKYGSLGVGLLATGFMGL